MASTTGVTRLVARGRKRDSSSCVAPHADCVANTSAAEQVADPGEQRPQKRRKRSTSTPAAPRSSQLSTRHRHSRSRVGSPLTDVEHVPPLRVSARLSRRIHPCFDSLNSDIYTHLADPDEAGNLLSERPVVSSTPNGFVGSQSVQRSRGRRRKIPDFTDENAKKDLMEKWTQMRQSRGALSLSGINKSASFSQMPLHENKKAGDGSVSSVQLEAIAQTDTNMAKSQTTTVINISQSQEPILDVCLWDASSTRAGSENALPMDTDALEEKSDSKLLSDGRIEQPIILSSGSEPSISNLDTHTDKDFPSDELAAVPETTHHPDWLQSSEFPPSSLSASPFREDSIPNGHTKLTNLSINEQAEAVSLNIPPKDAHLVSLGANPSDTGNIHLDSDEEFHLLDIPEIFTLPWVPVSSHLYVPPNLGKLVSGK